MNKTPDPQPDFQRMQELIDAAQDWRFSDEFIGNLTRSIFGRSRGHDADGKGHRTDD